MVVIVARPLHVGIDMREVCNAVVCRVSMFASGIQNGGFAFQTAGLIIQDWKWPYMSGKVARPTA